VLGLAVNVVSAWLLSGGHHHGHSHGHDHGHEHGEEPRRVDLGGRRLDIEVFEENVPPRFRVSAQAGALPASDFTIETTRPDGSRQLFLFEDRGAYLESRDEIPEPHAFLARARLMQAGQAHERELEFAEHEHEHGAGAHHRDNNMRAAVIHVMADAAVSVLVIIGLLLARAFGWQSSSPTGRSGYCATPAASCSIEPRIRAWPTRSAISSKPRAIGSQTCISGGSGPDISAPSSASPPQGRAMRRTTGSAWPDSPTCPTSPWRSSTLIQYPVEPPLMKSGATFTRK
jgi:hypothetical protein